MKRKMPIRRAGAFLSGLAALAVVAACTEPPPPVSAVPPGPRHGPREVAVARGKAEIEGGLLKLALPVAGVAARQLVQAGERVKAGQPLFELLDEYERAQADTTQAELALAQARARAAQAGVAPAQRQAKRYEAAALAGAAQPQQADAAAERLRQARADAEIATAEAAVAQARLAQQRAQLARYTLHAPEDGEVVELLAGTGSYLPAGAPALTLLAARPLQLRVELNAAYVDAVRVGMLASVVAESDSGGQTLKLPDARVLRISPVFGAGRLQDDAQRGPLRVVECVLEFETPAPLRAGQNVRVIFHE